MKVCVAVVLVFIAVLCWAAGYLYYRWYAAHPIKETPSGPACSGCGNSVEVEVCVDRSEGQDIYNFKFNRCPDCGRRLDRKGRSHVLT